MKNSIVKSIATLSLLVGLLTVTIPASAQIVVSPVIQSDLAGDMLADTVFVTDILLGDKDTLLGFSFGGLNFLQTSTPAINVTGEHTIWVDYLAKSSADKNDFSYNLGFGDNLIFENYGVVDGVNDSVEIFVEDGIPANFSFWNNDVTKGVFSEWSDENHFSVFNATSPNGAEFFLLAIDDRGLTDPLTQDWNDGNFLVTSFGDISQIAIPEPNSIGLLSFATLAGMIAFRRRL